jgi:CheY-like chemotaxis protein
VQNRPERATIHVAARMTTGTTVLIVDDNPHLRALIRTVLAGVADSVHECSDGDDVLTAYGAVRPDWVLVDLQMTRINGVEAIRRLRAAEPAAQVIVVTTYDDAHWRAAAFDAGACGYVAKDNLLDVPRLIEQRGRGHS